jgi:heme oxygenase
MEENQVQLSTYLKESTRSVHNEAETSDFQRQLGTGSISLEAYKAYLSQLFLVHNALERGLAASSETNEIATPWQFQTDYLERDLKTLGVYTGDIQPLTPTSEILFRIEQNARSNPLALLGYHYVLFGSKHGGKYIAVQIRKKFGFEGEGCLYFDPYGTTFQNHWLEFRAGLDKVNTSESSAQIVLDAAKEMFQYFGKLGIELDHLTPADTESTTV